LTLDKVRFYTSERILNCAIIRTVINTTNTEQHGEKWLMPMNNREELLQQSGLFNSWLEAAPFQEYRGWHLRAFEDEGGWTWDIIEPKALGGSWFESAKIYPNKSKALLEARKLIIRCTVSWELTKVLQELYAEQSISAEEYRSLVSSLQDTQAVSLH
jgi:hypothetical protein